MCGTFDNNLNILGLLAYWSQQAPVLVKYPQWGQAKDHPWWKTRLPKNTFNKETVYIFLPSNIQQPMCSAGCLMGNRAFKDTAKRPFFNVVWSLGELMTHTHTVDTHYVGLQMQSIQMCEEKYDDILTKWLMMIWSDAQ